MTGHQEIGSLRPLAYFREIEQQATRTRPTSSKRRSLTDLQAGACSRSAVAWGPPEPGSQRREPSMSASTSRPAAAEPTPENPWLRGLATKDAQRTPRALPSGDAPTDHLYSFGVIHPPASPSRIAPRSIGCRGQAGP